MNEYQQQWLYNYNIYEQCWRACKREHYLELFSNNDSGNVLKSSKIDTLVEIVNKTNGDLTKLNQVENELYM